MPIVEQSGSNGGSLPDPITSPVNITAGDGSNPALTVVSAAAGSDYEQIAYFNGADGAQMSFTSDGSLTVQAKQTDSTPLTINKAGGGFVLIIQGDGVVRFAGLPTSDPHASGHLWNNGGVLTLSAG